MQIGAMIDKGPANWQILQQQQGVAAIELAGRYQPASADQQAGTVYVRLVLEESGFSVLPWQPAKTLADQTWSLQLENIPAGGLYRLETCFSPEDNTTLEWSIRGDMIHHLGVGDLFVIAGQSNSAGYGKNPAYDPPELGVHVLRNSGVWDLAAHPLNDSTATLHNANRETANPGSSPWITFGRHLKKITGYPIGLLQASLGGSPLSAWNPDEDGTLYHLMLEIITSAGGNIKGVLWYQGCSDTEGLLAESYLERFGSFVSRLRSDLNNAQLPLLTIQLNRYVVPAAEGKNQAWGMIREAQRQAARILPTVFVVPANDCSLSDEIHNSSPANIILGERVACLAGSHLYGHGRPVKAPEIKQAFQESEQTICLVFDHVGGRLQIFGTAKDQLAFIIEDEAGPVPIDSWELKSADTLSIHIQRSLGLNAMVHGASEQNPAPFIPFDSDTYLPMLSFYNVSVQPAATIDI